MEEAAAFFAGTPQQPSAARWSEAEKATYKIAWLCRPLRVPRSSLYAWLA